MEQHSRPAMPRIRRRSLLAGGAALTGLGLSSVSPGSALAAPAAGLGVSATRTDHGLVATQCNVRTGAVATQHNGRPLVYLISDGNPVSFNVVNGDTGTLVGTFPLPPKSIGSFPCVAPDGTAYFSVRDGKSSLVHRYDPRTNEVEFLVESPTGDAVVRALRIDGDQLYGSTYPNARAFRHDLTTGETHDYGRVIDSTDKYAWGFEKVGNELYVGTGIGDGNVVVVDIATGEKTELPLPKEYDDTLTYFYWFRRIGHLVAMAFSPGLTGGTNTLFWDTRARQWVHDGAIPTFLNLNGPITEATPDGRAYYKSEDEIWEFDSTTGAVTPTGWIDTGLAATGSHRTLGMAMVGPGRRARPILFGGNNDGSFWRFDPGTGEHRSFGPAFEGAPLTAHTLAVGPEQRVYTSTYLGPGATGRFDPETGSTEVLESPGQVDSFLSYHDELLLGSYANAVVHRGTPSQPWDFGTNPSLQFQLIEWDQDRIIRMATDGTQIAFGTVADYGVTGGALTLLDPGGTPQVYRDLIPAQSVCSVVYGPDGLVYAGTSIRGGLSSPIGSGDAELIVFAPASRSMVHHTVPVADNDVVAELAVGPDERIWGITNTGHVFAFDPGQRTVTADIDLGTGQSPSPWGRASTLQAHPTDGLLYGIAGKKVFAFDPATRAWEFLDDHEYKQLAIADDGTVYAIDDTSLFSFTVQHT